MASRMPWGSTDLTSVRLPLSHATKGLADQLFQKCCMLASHLPRLGVAWAAGPQLKQHAVLGCKVLAMACTMRLLCCCLAA